MSKLSESKLVGPELVVSILSETDEPLTTSEFQSEVTNVVSFCLASSAIALNLMWIKGTIKGKRTEDRKRVWWVEN